MINNCENCQCGLHSVEECPIEGFNEGSNECTHWTPILAAGETTLNCGHCQIELCDRVSDGCEPNITKTLVRCDGCQKDVNQKEAINLREAGFWVMTLCTSCDKKGASHMLAGE